MVPALNSKKVIKMSNIVTFPSRAVVAPVAEIATPSTEIITTPTEQDRAVFSDYAHHDQKMFDIESLPLSSEYGVIPDKKGLFVNGKNINIVSHHYEIVQPKKVYETFVNVAESSGLTINKVLTNPANGGLMISALFDQVKITGEDHNVNLVFYTSHCGKYKTFLTLDMLRMACFNQVPCLYQNKDRFIFAEKHYKNALNIDLLQKYLENIPASVQAYNTKAEMLKDIKLSKADFVEWYKEQIKLSEASKQYDSKIANIANTYTFADGQEIAGDGTAWKAFNAITYMNTHQGRNTQFKEENKLIKGGNNSIEMMDQLLAMAG